MSSIKIAAFVYAGAIALSVPLQQPPPSPPGSWSAQRTEGAYLFATFCATCHGKTGMGDGPMSASLNVRPANLTELASHNGGQFPSVLVYRTIDGRQRVRGHGGPDMPVWGDIFSKTTVGWDPAAVQHRIDRLVEYVESLQIRSGEQ
jgi:mono/diheme cytochrome c family protein